MDKNQLIFSSDCAINFDDLGQFKDYTQDIQTMLHNMKQIKNNSKTTLKQQLLKQILKADPQDTFHAPDFKQLINIIVDILIQRKQYFQTIPQLYKLIFNSLIQILQDSFVSYQFSQDIGPKICQFIIDEGKIKSFSQFQKMNVLSCISKLAKKLSYIDDLQKYSQLLFNCIDEQTIVIEKDVTDEWKKMMVNVYCQTVELSTRNRKVREISTHKISEQSILALDHLFLGYKINLWRKDSQKAKMYLKRMQLQQLTKYEVFKLAIKGLNTQVKVLQNSYDI